MKNIQYITDDNGNRTSVIISSKEYEEKIKDHSSKIEKHLVQHLVLSLLDISFEYLKVPMNRKNRGKDSTKFLKCLVDKSKTTDGFSKNYEVTVMDKELFQCVGERYLRTQRNKNLFPAIKKKQIKAVIYRLKQYPSSEKKGSVYRLNFLESINEAVNKFLNQTIIDSKDLFLLIEDARRTKLDSIEKSNSVFRNLIFILKKHLDNLPENYINNTSSQSQGSKDYQDRKNGKI